MDEDQGFAYNMKLAIARKLIFSKWLEALGGEIIGIATGAAALPATICKVFNAAGIQVREGYGQTESSPVITFNRFEPGGCKDGTVGMKIPSVEIKIAENGEICAKGPNIMMGYYKNPEATAEVFTEDGWLRTGDLGTMDGNGNIFIRGRSKTMILSSSGQNIFPEEIKARLNNMPFILESLVIERHKKLVALVYADYESLESLGLNHAEHLKTIMDENLKSLNNSVAAYEKVSEIQLYPTEFEKTPKKSIKRYLYNSIVEK